MLYLGSFKKIIAAKGMVPWLRIHTIPEEDLVFVPRTQVR